MVFVLAAIFVASPGALAEQPAGASSEAAKAHFDRGVVEYNLGRFPAAIVEFEQAYEIDHAPSILYNIAQSHKKQGNKEKALFFYRRYLEQAPDAPNRAEVEQRVKELSAAVEKAPPPPVSPPPLQPKPAPAAVPPLPASQTAPSTASAVLVSSPAPAAERTSLVARPWFWVLVGGVVAAGVVTAVLLTRSAHDPTASLGMMQWP
jgi:tetratricopeptide (TPR) repeat protein